MFADLDDQLVVFVPAAAVGEQLLGPVHEEVRLGFQVERDVVGRAERGLLVPHAAEVVPVPPLPAQVLVARDNLVGALKACRHSQSGSGAVPNAGAPRAGTELLGNKESHTDCNTSLD